MGRKQWIWQQDNASIHTAKAVMEWFKKNKVSTVDWPACSPDLSIIENIWHVLSEMVYADDQFTGKIALASKIEACAAKISPDTIKSLYSTMRDRLIKVKVAKGGQIQ